MYLNRYCKYVKNLCELGILYDHIYGNNTLFPTLKKLSILRNLSLF